MTIWRMRIAWWIPEATHTVLRIRNTYCFSTVQWLGKHASMLRLYVHCLSSLVINLVVYKIVTKAFKFNPLNAELNPICYLLALLAHHFLHVSRIKVKSLTLRLLMSYIYIYGAPILDVSRSHTTTHYSR